MPSINVSARIIADISLGIYRSPANALKELVSNAFDADATVVKIQTNRPLYKTMTYYDDGEGMTPERFKFVMSRIGGSDKRVSGIERTKKFNRPIIGKIGIGILAVAQICNEFTVVSSVEGDERKFTANIDLSQFEAEEIHRQPLGSTSREQKVKIGEYDLYEELEDKNEHYTKIILRKIREDFLTDMKDESKNFKDYSKKSTGKEIKVKDMKGIEGFRTIVEKLSHSDFALFRDYYSLLWELALTTPVAYFDDGPVRDYHGFDFKKRELKSYNFSLYVDGYELRKPILFPNDPDIVEEEKDYNIFEINSDDLLSQNENFDLRFVGYIYSQRSKIKNNALQGLLLRIRNVAIGSYDKEFLKYPLVLGFVGAQLSGEIYVEKGLEQALNIDRNSFRQSDKQYKILQKAIYELLTKIHNYSRERSNRYNIELKKNKYEIAKDSIEKKVPRLLKDFAIPALKVEHRNKEGKGPIEQEDNKIIINIDNKIFKESKIDKITLEKILILLEIQRCYDILNKADLLNWLERFWKIK